jgi:hypothetical protein
MALNVDCYLCGLTDSTLSLSVSAVGRPGSEVWLVMCSYWRCRFVLSAIDVPKLKTLLFCVSSTQWIVIVRVYVCVFYEWKLHVDPTCSEYVCGIRDSPVDTPIRLLANGS